uniref:Uncharacterized protein n=1 Tax=Anopheles farauti TaxID=69004 RepID=A0A182QWN1_9DIPT
MMRHLIQPGGTITRALAEEREAHRAGALPVAAYHAQLVDRRRPGVWNVSKSIPVRNRAAGVDSSVHGRKPPSTVVERGTIVRLVVVRAELLALVEDERIACRPSRFPERLQLVVLAFVSDRELVVMLERTHSAEIFQLDQQLVRRATGAQYAMELFQPEPKLTTQLAEPVPVLGPVAVEVHRTVVSLLENDPIASVRPVPGVARLHVERTVRLITGIR